MSRAKLILVNAAIRARAIRWINTAKDGVRVEFKEPQRSLEQNDKMWAMLTDVSRQHPYHGKKRTPEQWKLIFLDALKRENEFVPSLDGRGAVQISGRSSSDLSVAEMRDLIELIYAYAARHVIAIFETRKSNNAKA